MRQRMGYAEVSDESTRTVDPSAGIRVNCVILSYTSTPMNVEA
jgi:hypothetical protein